MLGEGSEEKKKPKPMFFINVGMQQGEGEIQSEYQSLPFLFDLLANWGVCVSQHTACEPVGGLMLLVMSLIETWGGEGQALLVLLMEYHILIKRFLDVVAIGNSPLGSYPGILGLNHRALFNFVKYKS